MVTNYDEEESPRKIWEYGFLWPTQITKKTSTKSGGLRANFPLQNLTGETPDIYEYLDFCFYDHVSYKENARLGMTDIGRWIGISHRVGRIMSYQILAHKGTVI